MNFHSASLRCPACSWFLLGPKASVRNPNCSLAQRLNTHSLLSMSDTTTRNTVQCRSSCRMNRTTLCNPTRSMNCVTWAAAQNSCTWLKLHDLVGQVVSQLSFVCGSVEPFHTCQKQSIETQMSGRHVYLHFHWLQLA